MDLLADGPKRIGGAARNKLGVCHGGRHANGRRNWSERRRKEKAKSVGVGPAMRGGWLPAWRRCLPPRSCTAPAMSDRSDEGIGEVLVSRRLNNGNVAFSVFLVDMYCLGVKDAFADIRAAGSVQREPLRQACRSQRDDSARAEGRPQTGRRGDPIRRRPRLLAARGLSQGEGDLRRHFRGGVRRGISLRQGREADRSSNVACRFGQIAVYLERPPSRCASDDVSLHPRAIWKKPSCGIDLRPSGSRTICQRAP